MAKKCKGKGPAYERWLCKELSRWVSCGQRVDCFWRSAMSGGRATLQSRKKTGGKFREEFGAQAGDITSTHERGNHLTTLFVLDGKHYKDLDVTAAFFGQGGRMVKEWKKLLRDADATGKIPMMIARQNFRPDIVVTTQMGIHILRNGGDLPLLASLPVYGMRVCLFTDLLALSYKKIRSVASLRSIRLQLE